MFITIVSRMTKKFQKYGTYRQYNILTEKKHEYKIEIRLYLLSIYTESFTKGLRLHFVFDSDSCSYCPICFTLELSIKYSIKKNRRCKHT